ncbi:hypothetical protein DHEL01_v200279 [Diaporthe helianthi]|uniref:Uncharacterized protein n=1 Tax=Diaporthe helianthi TaxID=158607 RepID=A0A2P5IFR5_DIAHE|nr:hypothetical protein DHEL01_v200279 [Diaporthe helianthi]
MPSADPPHCSMDAVLQAVKQEHGTAAYLEVVEMVNHLDASKAANPNAPLISHFRAANMPMQFLRFLGAPKWVAGYEMLRAEPKKWFRDTQVDERDLALIKASPVPWIEIGKQSFLKHVHHKLKDQPFETTMWTVENDKTLRGMISAVGAGFTGFANPPIHLPGRNLECMTGSYPPCLLFRLSSTTDLVIVNVNISGKIAPGVTWGLLSGRPSKARVLAGPSETCDKHPWDIMILRDFHTNTSGLDGVERIASRQYDILLMKMCEDMDHPWVVLAVKDSGPLEMPSCSSEGHCDNSCMGC